MSHKDDPKKSTLDIYKDLLQIEVRALVQRVAELTQTVGSLFEEVSSVAGSLESTVEKVKKFGVDIEACRQEITTVKRALNAQEQLAGDLLGKICQLEQQLNILETSACTCTDSCKLTEIDT